MTGEFDPQSMTEKEYQKLIEKCSESSDPDCFTIGICKECKSGFIQVRSEWVHPPKGWRQMCVCTNCEREFERITKNPTLFEFMTDDAFYQNYGE